MDDGRLVGWIAACDHPPITQSPITQSPNGRWRAAGCRRPLGVSCCNRSDEVELLRPDSEIALLVPFVGLMERPERVAEKTVLGSVGRGRGAEVMRAFVVSDENRETVRIVEPFRVRLWKDARYQDEQDKGRDRASPAQRLEH